MAGEKFSNVALSEKHIMSQQGTTLWLPRTTVSTLHFIVRFYKTNTPAFSVVFRGRDTIVNASLGKTRPTTRFCRTGRFSEKV